MRLLGLVLLLIACSSTVEGPNSADAGAAGLPVSGGEKSGDAAAGSQSGAVASVTSGAGGHAVATAGQAGAADADAGGGRGGIAVTAGAAGTTSQAGTATSGAVGAGGALSGGSAGSMAVAGPSGAAGVAGASGAAGAGGDGPTEPVCVCSSGPCCDGCYFRQKSYFCGEVIRSSQCLSNGRISHDYWNLFCSGDRADACTRWGAHTKFVDPECGAGLACAGPDGTAACVAP